MLTIRQSNSKLPMSRVESPRRLHVPFVSQDYARSGSAFDRIARRHVSLQNDFSITNGNPNGDWSYSEGATPSSATLLTFQTPLNNNALYPALRQDTGGRATT